MSSKGDPPCTFAGTLANYIIVSLSVHINTVAALLSLSSYDKYLIYKMLMNLKGSS